MSGCVQKFAHQLQFLGRLVKILTNLKLNVFCLDVKCKAVRVVRLCLGGENYMFLCKRVGDFFNTVNRGYRPYCRSTTYSQPYSTHSRCQH